MHPYKMMLAQELSDFERNVRRHLISLCGDIGWLARSPDLTPCDFFLWLYLKAKVYARRPGTIEKSKEAIREEVAAIPPAMTRKAMDNFRERLQECVINNGSHFSYVILKVFEKMASYVLCKNKIIFCSFIISFGFYFPFKMCELYLPHPVYYSLNNITMTANMFSALQKPC